MPARTLVATVALAVVAVAAGTSEAATSPVLGGAPAGAAAGAASQPGSSLRELRGAPVSPVPVRLRQPDGTTFAAVPYGDSWVGGYETLGGYTVVQGADGAWRYANGRTTSGTLRGAAVVQPGGHPAPATRPHQRPSPTAVGDPPASPSPAPRNSGSQPTLVILVQFNDRASVGSTQANWASQYFGASGSVAAFYDQASYGTLAITPATDTSGASNGVVGWLTLNQNHPNFQNSFGASEQALTHDAIIAADPYVDFGAYDTSGDGYLEPDELHIVVIAAGYETSYGGTSASCSPSIWGHMSGLSSGNTPTVDSVKAGYYGYMQFGEWQCSTGDNPGHLATIGIMVHELGHDLGWPDLYDVDLSSNGVGYWSIMSYGSWNATAGQYAGQSPALPDAWSRYYQGWVTPTTVTGSLSGASISDASSSDSVYLLGSNPGGVDWSFYDASGTGEYFLVENRELTGFDAGLPGCGLLVWHVDESRTSTNTANADESRRLVDLEEADGQAGLDGAYYWGSAADPYPGSTGATTFDDSSNPSSTFYSGTPSGAAMTVTSGGCATTMTADLAGSEQADTQPPRTSAPRTAVQLGARLRGPVPATVRWSASDSGSGVARYQLRVEARGATSTRSLVGPAPTSAAVRLAPGVRYRLGVRARDVAGNWSVFRYGPALRAKVLDDSAAAVHYSAGWGTSSAPPAYHGTTTNTRRAGATATVTVTGRCVALVATRSSRSGKVALRLDGGRRHVVDLHRSSLGGRVVWSSACGAVRSHTLRVTNLATPGHPWADVDAVVVLR